MDFTAAHESESGTEAKSSECLLLRRLRG